MKFGQIVPCDMIITFFNKCRPHLKPPSSPNGVKWANRIFSNRLLISERRRREQQPLSSYVSAVGASIVSCAEGALGVWGRSPHIEDERSESDIPASA